MKLFCILKNPKYFLLAVVSSLVFLFIYVYAQVLGITENFFFWFTTIQTLNLVVFFIFVIVFGITISYQAHVLRQPKTCPAKSIGTTSTASALGFLVASCPSCASVGFLFLPLSVTAFFAHFGIYINIFSILLLLFTLNYLGAFKK